MKIELHEAFKVDNHYLQVAAALQSSSRPLKFSNNSLIEDGNLQFNGRIYVLAEGDLKKTILQ